MVVNTGNAFSALVLSEYMAQSLPENATPQLRRPFDAIALLAHACMLAVGFRLIGLGEEHNIGIPFSIESICFLEFRLALNCKSLIELPPLYLEHSSDPSSPPQPLPSEWNSSTTSDYAFRYAHTQSSLQYLVKVSRLGSKAVINGLGIGDEKVHTLDLITKDFVSESAFPYTAPSATATASSTAEENTSHDHPEVALSLRKLFISAGRLTDAGSLLKLQIIQKLAPGLQKEGYEDSAHAASQSSRSSNPHHDTRDPDPHPGPVDPLRDDRPFPLPLPATVPRPPFPAGDFPPPGFEDEYEINRPLRGGGGGIERRPLNIGERDLYPPGLGPHDPLRIGGGGGFGGGFGGGGMHPTFDDPMFGGGGGGFGGGGGVFDPRAPPGARYDPVGPGDGPPMGRGGGPGRFPGGGGGAFGGAGGAGGAPYNPFGGFGGNDFI